MSEQVRYYQIAGITVQVESDLPITDTTFRGKFARFRVDGPGADTVVLRHHFGLPVSFADPGLAGLGQPVYRKPPWAIYRDGASWVYLGIAAKAEDPSIHRVAIFNADYSQADIYSPDEWVGVWREGGLASLTLFPSDQLLLARLLAERHGCLLHSAGLGFGGRGFVFVGHSGAGKSTTVRLARKRLGDRVEVLCDDRNVVRWWPEGFRVHGTWSHGDVPDVSSASPPLQAVLFLEKHASNQIVPLTDRKEIWRRLLAALVKPMVTADWWRSEMNVLERVVHEVPCLLMRSDKSGAIVDEWTRLGQ